DVYLIALWVRGDAAALKEFRQQALSLGDESFLLYVELVMEIAGGEPGLLYGLAADAHAAGHVRSLVTLAHFASEGFGETDAYDRQRIGELLQTINPSGSYNSSFVLAHVYLAGQSELGIDADPERAVSLLEDAAMHGTAEQ